ncbi:hypothetical protein WJX73_001945 [Symbiochloris irregularis]|uniref:Uncharacterized protein n=1 Tax=Symbiochloris irregularis TaxID=706552 RepID=A0AAW1Q3G3_9CHLO
MLAASHIARRLLDVLQHSALSPVGSAASRSKPLTVSSSSLRPCGTAFVLHLHSETQLLEIPKTPTLLIQMGTFSRPQARTASSQELLT